MKHTALIRTDDLKELVLPPGGSLHRADGQQITPAQANFYVNQGEIVEIRQNGQRVGRIRPPSADDRFTPNSLDTIGRMLEAAKLKNYDDAVNWIDRVKDRFWCPLCAKNQSHPMFFSCWVSPEPACNPICYYAICKHCGKEGEAFQKRNDLAGFRRLADLAEQKLISRYPHIAAGLPTGYLDGSKD